MGTSLNTLSRFIEKFGFSDSHLLKSAINDLLKRDRPLLWSDYHHKVTNLRSSERIMLTPIGIKYFEIVFGNYLYDEALLAKDQQCIVPVGDVFEFHTKLTDQDLKEIEYHIVNSGNLSYKNMYPKSRNALSIHHSRGIMFGLNLREGDKKQFYDPERENWIKTRASRIIDGVQW